MQPARAILRNEFKHRLAPALPAFQSTGHDLAARRRSHAQLKFGDAPKVASILITPRTVHQEILDRVEF